METGAAIICVTPNAALDRTMVVPDFAVGRISRITRGVAVPGGKGLNMTRAVKILGGRPVAMGLLGGHTGRMVAEMVDDDGYEAAWTWFDGETRTCTIIANADGVSTVINESGRIEAGDWSALAEDIAGVAQKIETEAVCFCGSLPLGAPSEAPADCIRRLKELGVRVWVDASGDALAKAIEARPYAIKVNSGEFAGVMEVESRAPDELIKAAGGLIEAGVRIVVISLGAEGAMLMTDGSTVHAIPPVIQPVDPIASGDCLHAGIVTALARGETPAEAIRRGVAAGTVNALYAGGAQFTYEHYLRVLQETRVETVAD